MLKLDRNEPFCLGLAAHLRKACCTPTAGPQPWNSLLLALTSDPQSLFVGSELGLQERAVEWLGQRSAAIRYLQLRDVIY
jgi:hypothetical protein